ncbi:histidine phosphatase family protein [Dysgonomonas reticulitermitis]
MLPQIHKHYSENDKLSLLIRHADRDKIPSGEFGNDVLLNEKGKERALNFGKRLSELKISRILTSPIERCVQTAPCIVKGYGKPLEIIKATELGAPGLHITDEKIAGNFFLTAGFDEMYHRIINDIPIPGIPNAEQFNKLMTDFLIENTKENGITLFITHDLLIAFYHYSINKTVYTKENWVKYLGGLILKNGRYEE